VMVLSWRTVFLFSGHLQSRAALGFLSRSWMEHWRIDVVAAATQVGATTGTLVLSHPSPHKRQQTGNSTSETLADPFASVHRRGGVCFGLCAFNRPVPVPRRVPILKNPRHINQLEVLLPRTRATRLNAWSYELLMGVRHASSASRIKTQQRRSGFFDLMGK